MTLIHALLLGIVEGLTEFLPISSTGHLILISSLLHIPMSEFLVVFEIAIQLGAILAVVITYWEKLFSLALMKRLLIAFTPTAIIGVLIYPHIKYLLSNPLIVGCTLLLGGIIILFAENYYAKQPEKDSVYSAKDFSIKEAFILGLLQTLAIVPGVSRSGALIVGGLFMNLERKNLTEFTFLLAVPTMFAATAYSLYKNIDVVFHTSTLLPLIVGGITSCVVALMVIKAFIEYIRRHSFVIFGFYRIILGIFVILFFV